MKIKEIIEMPTVVDNVHESVFRAYHTLYYVKTMVERGDSKETIIDFIDFIRSCKCVEEFIPSQSDR